MSVDVAAEFRGGGERRYLRDLLRLCEASYRGAAYDVRVGIATSGLVFFFGVSFKIQKFRK